MDPDHIRNTNHSTVGTEPTTEEKRRAVRSVASGARDGDDCAMLLEALGLRAEEGRLTVHSGGGAGSELTAPER